MTSAVRSRSAVTGAPPADAAGDLERWGPVAAIVGAALGIVADVIVHGAAASVPSNRVSYPLSSASWAWLQVFYAFTQALMAAGIIALVRSGLVAPSRPRRTTATLAGVGMALTVPGELLLITAAGSTNDSTAASLVSAIYGVIVFVVDVGLIGYGVLALRQRAHPALLAVLPVALGLFHLLVLTPVSVAVGFASDASFAAFVVSYLLNATIAVALLRTNMQL